MRDLKAIRSRRQRLSIARPAKAFDLTLRVVIVVRVERARQQVLAPPPAAPVPWM
jgi:hypothetical protein